MASDFHTHSLPSDGSRALISTDRPISETFVSLEYHPWHLPEKFTRLPGEFAEKLAEFNALGEIGLDKLRGPELDVQLHYFEQLLQLAQDMNKPVVLHIVRCYQELFAILKKFSLRVMVHGFCGSPELLDELWKRNITVSLSHRILDKPDLIEKLNTSQGRFGFESDCEQTVSVKNIIARCGIINAEMRTDQYFNDFLEI